MRSTLTRREQRLLFSLTYPRDYRRPVSVPDRELPPLTGDLVCPPWREAGGDAGGRHQRCRCRFRHGHDGHGAALAALVGFAEMTQRFDQVNRELADNCERMAKLEGSLEGFLAGRRDRDAV